MTRQEAIEELQDRVSKQYIQTEEELIKATAEIEYEGGENIEPFEEVLAGMGWNICDRCGALGDSEMDFMWVDCFPFEEDNEEDQKLLKALDKEGQDYCAICWKCVNELKGDKNE